MLALRFMKMKIYEYNAGHMTKMAVMLAYGIISSKICFLGTRKLVL